MIIMISYIQLNKNDKLICLMIIMILYDICHKSYYEIEITK